MRILVVEDDFISRRLLCRFLAPFGGCDVAGDGAEAVTAVAAALATDAPYDLICLDIMMPGLTGQDALAAIRDLEARHGYAAGRGAKIVMTTAIEDHGSIRRAFSAAADGYVIKPVEKPKFLATLCDLGFNLPELAPER